jgi:pilus assembly protein CpaE
MRAILICPNLELRTQFERIASFYDQLKLVKSYEHYPEEDALRRLVRICVPDVLFVSVEDPDAAEQITQQLDTEFPSLQRVALSTSEQPAVLRLALHLRMAELLVPPIDNDHFAGMLKRLGKHLELHKPTTGEPGKIFAFMPVKGGSGASTIAANASLAFADLEDTNVLMADFDVYSGVTGFMFKVEHDYCVSDAIKRNKELDDEAWQRLIKKSGKLDLLLSGAPMVDEGLTAAQIVPVLDFARKTYSIVAADISDSFDERSTAVMREADKIFLVTTPDLAALRLARLKAQCLRKLDWEDKAVLIVNRVSRRMELSLDEIEETVGLPVFATFPCVYADVTRATRKGEASPKLVPNIQAFVEKLLSKKAPELKRPRFIERFAIVPARYGFQ